MHMFPLVVIILPLRTNHWRIESAEQGKLNLIFTSPYDFDRESTLILVIDALDAKYLRLTQHQHSLKQI